MEENKVLISLDRYNELLTAETCKTLLEELLFANESVRLNYDKSALYFEPNGDVVKMLFPINYKATLEKLKDDLNV